MNQSDNKSMCLYRDMKKSEIKNKSNLPKNDFRTIKKLLIAR